MKKYGDGYVTLDEWLRNSIENRLGHFKTKRQVARSLGISYSSLYRHMNRFDIKTNKGSE